MKLLEKIDIREIVKPEYRDPSILDVYYEVGSESYSYSKGYTREYIVTVIRKITSDQARREYYPFSNKAEAIAMIEDLKIAEDVKTITEQYSTLIEADNEVEKHKDVQEYKKSEWFDSEDNVITEMRRLLDRPMRVRETGVSDSKAQKKRWVI